MSDRLRPRDLAFLASETRTTPTHNSTLEIFDPGEDFDYDQLAALIGDRISFVPRYRQKLQWVPGRIANPIWVDDPEFDLNYHVRRSALPRPGNIDQMRELVARIISRPLDRSRPLWEVYFIEGIEHDRVAILVKSHQILVDGVATVDLGQVLLDDSPEQKPMEHDEWHPPTPPSPASVLMSALHESLTHPTTVLDTVTTNVSAIARSLRDMVGQASLVANALAHRRFEMDTPINRRLSQQRRFLAIRTDLADYRLIRRTHGGTVNDVILATITGGLRTWMLSHAEDFTDLRHLKAVVPMSVIDDDLEPTSLGSQIAPHFVDLPIGERNPVLRLQQVSYSFQAHKDTGRAVGARRLAGISGFAPTTFHALGARVAAQEMPKGFHLAVVNVPGPQFPLFAAGAQMLETYPVHPLMANHSLALGVTSYDGGVFFGITADRDAIPDLDLLGHCITDALAELVQTTTPERSRAPRGRPRSKGRS